MPSSINHDPKIWNKRIVLRPSYSNVIFNIWILKLHRVCPMSKPRTLNYKDKYINTTAVAVKYMLSYTNGSVIWHTGCFKLFYPLEIAQKLITVPSTVLKYGA